MIIHDLTKEYHFWLCELVGVDQIKDTYWNLIQALQNTPFRWTVPNDDNRAFEGKNLRERFCDELDIEYNLDEFGKYASLLEVIIGLAYRCEDIMYGEPGGRPMREWFWIMMSNSGLGIHTDGDWDSFVVDEIIDRILDRTYKRNGTGGLFPLKKDRKDQRKIELWYQMNAYLVENYYNYDVV